MHSKVSQLFLGALVSFALLVFSQLLGITTNAVYAQEPEQSPATSATSELSIANNVCKGVLATQEVNVPAGTTVQSCDQDSQKEFSDVIKRIINIFSIVVGAVSVIMIIIGGFRYIISGGDSSGVGAAKNTVLYAIVGLVIVLFAQVMVRFIVARLSPTQPSNNQGSTAEFQEQVSGENQ